jgi:hypothetical protein
VRFRKKSHSNAYADDFQLYSSGCHSDVSNYILRQNGDLERVYRWSLDNDLVLNGSKTHVPAGYNIFS